MPKTSKYKERQKVSVQKDVSWGEVSGSLGEVLSSIQNLIELYGEDANLDICDNYGAAITYERDETDKEYEKRIALIEKDKEFERKKELKELERLQKKYKKELKNA